MSGAARTLSRRKRLFFAMLAICGSVCLAAGIAELIARALGHAPYRPAAIDIRVEPGGKYQSRHPVLGYRHLPGRFRITFPDGHSWTATHRDDTLRITRPLASYATDVGKDEIWLFGCSFIHGWGVNDHETLGWQLQLRLPALEVVNFGVGGYGTWQSLLQYREAVKERPAPAWIVLGYAGFHDERNTRSRNWRRATFEYDRFGTTAQPYVRLGENGELVERFDPATYRAFFLLRHSALANFLDLAYGKAEEERLRSHRVTRMIIDRFAQEARDHGSRFVLAGVTRTRKTRSMLTEARSRGIPVVDISVDLNRPENRVAFDRHPSAFANRKSARRLAAFLERLEGQTSR